VSRDRCGRVRRVIWCPFYRVGEPGGGPSMGASSAAGGVRHNSSRVGRGRGGDND
jgi:hypothetical protein